MQFGAASHFDQGWSTSIIPSAAGIDAFLLRDEMPWTQVEKADGTFVFSSTRSTYPDLLAVNGIETLMVFAHPKAYVDGSVTPYTDEGRADFAEYVAQVLTRFPQITTIEIGNEFNAQNFVSGTVKTAGYGLRDDYYMDLLKAVHDRLEVDFAGVKILGGATHSIPLDYIDRLYDLDAAQYSDGIAIHPYTTPPEQIEAQLDLLRQRMGADQQPIHVTEFGQEFDTPEDAPSYLIKMVSALSAGGVETAIWYALREEPWFPNMDLLKSNGALTPGGEAFAFSQSALLAEGDAVNVSPDDFTRLYQYGDNTLVAWGVPRDFTVTGSATIYDARGNVLSSVDRLSEDEPIIIVTAAPLSVGGNVIFAQSEIVGDSYYQFDVSNGGGNDFEGDWSWYELRGDGVTNELVTLGGGDWQSEGWRPYLGGYWRRPLSATETAVQPVDFSGGTTPTSRYSVLEKFTASDDARVIISGHWDVGSNTTDGIDLHILHNGLEIHTEIVTDETDVLLSGIDLLEGDTLDFIVGPNVSSTGDGTSRRIQIFVDDSEPEPEPEPEQTLIAPEAVLVVASLGSSDSDSFAFATPGKSGVTKAVGVFSAGDVGSTWAELRELPEERSAVDTTETLADFDLIESELPLYDTDPFLG